MRSAFYSFPDKREFLRHAPALGAIACTQIGIAHSQLAIACTQIGIAHSQLVIACSQIADVILHKACVCAHAVHLWTQAVNACTQVRMRGCVSDVIRSALLANPLSGRRRSASGHRDEILAVIAYLPLAFCLNNAAEYPA